MPIRLERRTRQRQFSGFRRRIWIVFIPPFIYLLFLLFGNVGANKKAVASVAFYSVANGEWSNNAIWSHQPNASSPCNCNPGTDFNQVAFITHKITALSDTPFKISGGGEVNVIGKGNIVFNTDLEVSGGSALNIIAGDSVTVNGNLVVSSGSNINVTGYFLVTGNAVVSSSSVCGSGKRILHGTLTGDGKWCGMPVSDVELLHFNALQAGNAVSLSWTTASEVNINNFIIERSGDGKIFKELARKPGSGNSTRMLNYTALDETPMEGINYYRLKQDDNNGNFLLLPVIRAEYYAEKSKMQIAIQSIEPDPFIDKFKLNYSAAIQRKVRLQIKNTSGLTVCRETLNASKGTNTYAFTDNIGLPPGIYIVNMISDSEVVSQKLLKQ